MPRVTAAGAGHGAEAEREFLQRLRAGDEAAFAAVVRRNHAAMVRLAGTFVGSRAEAEEVAQEAWMAVLGGLDRFEERSSLRTWIFAVLVNKARSRAVRERRDLPFSAFDAAEDDGAPTVDPARFRGAGDAFAGYWTSVPFAWWALPEQRATEAETRAVIHRALAALPLRQRQVVTLRDVDGFSADEVCAALGVSPGNQRVLLHRGRAQLRAALEAHVAAGVAP